MANCFVTEFNSKYVAISKQKFYISNGQLFDTPCPVRQGHAGILVFFLPPYSPDFNPIENVFGNIKSYLKIHDEVIQSANNLKAIFSSAFNDITMDNTVYCSKCTDEPF